MPAEIFKVFFVFQIQLRTNTITPSTPFKSNANVQSPFLRSQKLTGFIVVIIPSKQRHCVTIKQNRSSNISSAPRRNLKPCRIKQVQTGSDGSHPHEVSGHSSTSDKGSFLGDKQMIHLRRNSTRARHCYPVLSRSRLHPPMRS